jgi:hypothetical protein
MLPVSVVLRRWNHDGGASRLSMPLSNVSHSVDNRKNKEPARSQQDSEFGVPTNLNIALDELQFMQGLHVHKEL